jgi:hydrogenase nickel incorporation protein HypA/HybF
MHEYSLVLSLMQHIEAHATRHRAAAVRRVWVRIGELSGVEPALLRSAYELLRDRTRCAGAALDIVPVPACWACRTCGAAVPSPGPLRCVRCGGVAKLTAGDDIVLERIELEVGDV